MNIDKDKIYSVVGAVVFFWIVLGIWMLLATYLEPSSTSYTGLDHPLMR